MIAKYTGVFACFVWQVSNGVLDRRTEVKETGKQAPYFN